MNIKILEKQSQFNKDLNAIIDTISPYICDKKITKREIDKANNALIDKFGKYKAHTNHEGKIVLIPHYHLYLQKDYSTTITIMKNDRSISEGDGTYYIPDNSKTIYLDRETGGISKEELGKYYNTPEQYPTKSQILASYKKYEMINAKIRELENKRSELPFHYYFK